MNIRPMPSALLTLLLLAALGCGGAGKPAETGGSGSSDSDSSSSDKSSSGDSDGESADSEGGDAKAGADSSGGERVKIPSGLQMLDRRSLSLDFALNLLKNGEGKGVQSGSWSFSEERTMRVKSAKKDVIKELQVVYGKWEAKPLLGLTYEMPMDGKTYMLQNDGSGLKITRGSSDHVEGGDEQRAIKAEYGWVGERSPLRQALADSKLEAGANLGKSEELAQLILGAIPGADSTDSELSATIDKVEGSGARKKAILKIEVKATIKSNKTSFALELNGTAAVDVATGWVVAADLSGTTSSSGSITVKKQGELEVSGKGKVTLTRKGEFK
jgi:hypothetical protein